MKEPLSAGFEPAREDPNGFQVHRLNHSATTTVFDVNCEVKNYVNYEVKYCHRLLQPILRMPPLDNSDILIITSYFRCLNVQFPILGFQGDHMSFSGVSPVI